VLHDSVVSCDRYSADASLRFELFSGHIREIVFMATSVIDETVTSNSIQRFILKLPSGDNVSRPRAFEWFQRFKEGT